MAEAAFEQWPTGAVPAGEGWFVISLRDAAWAGHDRFGTSCLLEHPRAERPHLGVRVRVVQPGEPVGLYHEEDAPEAFLVLAGECLLVVEEEERTLRAWDFFHSPAGTAHALVGAGDGPCAILGVGARFVPERFRYPVSEAAGRHGASVGAETAEPDEAYAGTGEWTLRRPDGWQGLPWA